MLYGKVPYLTIPQGTINTQRMIITPVYVYLLYRVLRQILLSLPPIMDMLFLLLFIMLIFAMLGELVYHNSIANNKNNNK